MDLSEEESAPLVNRERGGSQRSSSSSSSGPGLQVHVYFHPTSKEATTISMSSVPVSAEGVCVLAAQACEILPVYQSLFALASSDLSYWYPPTHVFNTDEKLHVHFRVRFFFANWFGQEPRTSYRYSLTRDRISPVLDYCVIDYLFAQCRSDFVASEAGVSPPLSAQEECLGLAVLDLWIMAKERHQSIRELCKTVSYKSCLPKAHRHDIQRRNRLERYRIRSSLKRFLQKLQGGCSVDACSLKLKYLMELSAVEPCLGAETFHVHPNTSAVEPCLGAETFHVHPNTSAVEPYLGAETFHPHPNTSAVEPCLGAETFHVHPNTSAVEPCLGAETFHVHPNTSAVEPCLGAETFHPHPNTSAVEPCLGAETFHVHPDTSFVEPCLGAETFHVHPNTSAVEHCLGAETFHVHPDTSAVEPCLGAETFHVHPNTSSMQETPFSAIRLSGETGIQTAGGQQHSVGNQEWQTFCDFQGIITIGVKRVCLEQTQQDLQMVTVTRRDDRCLEVKFQSETEARSFVSLIDGYFRLTTDSSHYFCEDLAPPSLLEGIRNYCHGPITSEFAVNKLRRSGGKGGTFLLRQSPKSFDNFYLTVCLQTSLGLDYKDCLVVKDKNGHYGLHKVHKSFVSLRELTAFYQHSMLLLANIPVKLGRCCPPRPKELTNLIIVRGTSSSVEARGSPGPPQRNKLTHIQFQKIKHEDLKWDECVGHGSFCLIFRGSKTDVRDGERHVTEVLLKVLDVDHKNYWESFFEAASMMSQISHKHILLVYGISVHGPKNIMVQEFVKCGALDLYLKRGGSVSVSWKLDVVKQLVSALTFLEEENIVHGNICAKNVLLAREGDPSQGRTPFIKLSDPGINVSRLDREVLPDRIPWVAPELLEAPGNLSLECDKWSFGTTVWEIFNNGHAPLLGWDLQRKREFYERRTQLPPSQWTELADLIGQCMNYGPAFRPSCRSLIRQLNSLITSDYVILHAAEPLPQRDAFWREPSPAHQLVFEERHLRHISQLGKGNFGSVELCRYDPLGDNTGGLVAVKRLQQNKASTLEAFQKEIHMLSVLDCDYIVQYRGVSYSMGRLSMSLVMEYVPHGSLIGYLEKNRDHVNTRRMMLFASQICKGLEYLQTKRYVHRDLAARNILVSSENLVKIADFGLTKIIPTDKEYYKVTHPGESPIFWYAPESITESRFSHKSDVWSFGVVLHELFSYCDHNCNPKRLYMQRIGNDVQGPSIMEHLVAVLKDGWRLPAPPICPPKVYSLMKRCWAYSVDERPSFSSLGDQISCVVQEERENLKG